MYSGFTSDEAQVSNICTASLITKAVLCERRFRGTNAPEHYAYFPLLRENKTHRNGVIMAIPWAV